MTIEQLAKLFSARGHGKRIRAKCPVHKSRGLTLALYDDGGQLSVKCFAGCSQDDVLAAVGLTWQDLKPKKEWIPPKEYAARLRAQKAAEKRARDLRIGVWILRFAKNGYTRQDRNDDISAICGAAIVLSQRPNRNWEGILRVHMERLLAANHCRERGMLPKVKP
jgi:hypothetical protein